jgi:predicted RecA/RadA family phage recombinase
MKNFVQDGHVLDLDPGATVPAGTGCLFGAALFGVAAVDAVSGTKSSFRISGVVNIAKTSALAIAVGDRLYWDATNKVREQDDRRRSSRSASRSKRRQTRRPR